MHAQMKCSTLNNYFRQIHNLLLSLASSHGSVVLNGTTVTVTCSYCMWSEVEGRFINNFVEV